MPSNEIWMELIISLLHLYITFKLVTMDPASIGLIAAVASTKLAIRNHQQERQSDRLIRANSMLKILSQNGYNLHRLKALCKKERAIFQSVEVDDWRKLYKGKNKLTRKIAKDLIELSGRSNTVYNRVKEVSAVGAETFIARERVTELIPFVVEAGYDLAAIKSLANSCKEANGWSANDVAEALFILANNDTAMMAIAEQAVELVVLCVQHQDVTIIVNRVVAEIGMEFLANGEGLAEAVIEIVNAIFS